MTNFWDVVDKLKEEAIGSPPSGDYFTTVQWAERYKIPLWEARCQLGALVKQGKLGVRKWGNWNYYTVQGSSKERKKT